MMLTDLFIHIEQTLVAQFNETSVIHHKGDRGENREEILRKFLEDHLPKRFGVAKGEIVSLNGEHSYSADIIIYDAVNCPILYAGKTQILPIEGVYGVIEIKSGLSKDELLSDCEKIEGFKRMTTRRLEFVERMPGVLGTFVASPPFGIILSYSLRNNSLASLQSNWTDKLRSTEYLDYYANFIAVLGHGIIRHEMHDKEKNRSHRMLSVEDFERITGNKKEKQEKIKFTTIVEETGDITFGRFYVYLLTILLKMKLSIPDLSKYLK
jgi:hypothetical protein